MAQTLFDENAKYIEDASILDQEIFQALNPIMKKYTEMGYSVREIAHIMNLTVLEIECMTILEWDAGGGPTNGS